MKPFDADPIQPPSSPKSNWEPRQFIRARKKPIVIEAMQIGFAEGFEVTTKQGHVRGKPMDYLIFAPDGEKYPCDRETFEATYEILGQEDAP